MLLEISQRYLFCEQAEEKLKKGTFKESAAENLDKIRFVEKFYFVRFSKSFWERKR